MCMLGYRLRETRCMWGSYHNCDKISGGVTDHGTINEVVGVLPAAPGCVSPGHPYWALDCQVQSNLERYK